MPKTYTVRLKAQADAPNYRNAGPASTQICATCKFANGGACTLYDFTFKENSVCDEWLPNVAAVRDRMQGMREGEKEKHSYGSTQFDMPIKVTAKALTFAADIDEDDLAEYGIEKDTHVTIKYGLRDDMLGAISEIAKSFAPIRLIFGSVSLFEKDEFDVVKVEVESDELRRLNQMIGAAAPNGDTNPTYNPHLTIAYVKKGAGQKYVGDGPLMGEGAVVDTITYSTSDGNKFTISLRSDFVDVEKANRSSFNVFKDAQGQYRWVAVSSTAFKDRDGEIVSTAALERAVEQADTTKEYGPLCWWHMQGADIGTCDYQMVHGRMLIESGTFNNAIIAQKVAQNANSLGLSIAFKHPKTEPDSQGVFHNISIFERSLTPAGRESNLFTSLSVKGDPMSNQLVKISGLVNLLGEENAAEILEKAASTQKQAEEKGHAYKATDTQEEAVDFSQMTSDQIIAYGQQLKAQEEEAAKAAPDDGNGQVDLTALATVIKEYVDDAITAAFKARDEQAAVTAKEQSKTVSQVERLQAELAALKGEQPRVSSTFRASQADSTKVDDEEAKKEATTPLDETRKELEAVNPAMGGLANVVHTFSQPIMQPYYGAPPNGGQQ